jgi:hypothetical protein
MLLAVASPFDGGRSGVMQAKSIARVFLWALWAISLALYIAAKIHFFTQYDPLRVGKFLREHSIYWLGTAALGFLIWLIMARFPQNRI